MSTVAAIIQRGTRGAQPAATAVSIGTLYCVTDESNLVERSNGTIWQSYSASGAGSGTVTNTGTLTANRLLKGNGSADITVGDLTGDVTTSGTMATTLANTAVTPASYTNTSLTVDSKGRITAASNGSGGSTTVGTFASLPGTCAVGDMYVFTDSVFNYAVCTTTNVWRYFIQGKEGTPVAPVSGWTGTNTGANWTATDSGGGAHILITNSSLNWRLLTKNQPGTPYNVTAYWTGNLTTGNTSLSGLYFYDGTKLMGIEILSSSIFRVNKMNSVTSDNSTAASFTGYNGFPSMATGIWARLTNSGSNLTFSWSADGVTFTTLFTEAIGTFITPTKYGIGGLTTSSGGTVTADFQSVFLS